MDETPKSLVGNTHVAVSGQPAQKRGPYEERGSIGGKFSNFLILTYFSCNGNQSAALSDRRDVL